MMAMCSRILALFMLLNTAAQADVHVFSVDVDQVDAVDQDLDDGICSINTAVDPDDIPVCTLRAAVMQANAIPLEDSVSIYLNRGTTYHLVSSGGDLDVVRPISFVAIGASENRATIDANSFDRVMQLQAGAGGTSLTGINLTGGDAPDGQGSGLLSQATYESPGDEIRLIDVAVSDNNGSEDSCALAIVAGRAVVADSSIDANPGNGICVRLGTKLEISESSVQRNNGAGLRVTDNGQLTMKNSSVFWNSYGVSLAAPSTFAHVNLAASTIALNYDFQFFALGGFNISVNGSIVGSGSDLSVLIDQPAATSSMSVNSSVMSGPVNGFAVSSVNSQLVDAGISHDSVEFGAVWALVPDVDSPVVDFVQEGNTICSENPFDQRGNPRHGHCDAGAIEIQKNDIFLDGFEI